VVVLLIAYYLQITTRIRKDIEKRLADLDEFATRSHQKIEGLIADLVKASGDVEDTLKNLPDRLNPGDPATPVTYMDGLFVEILRPAAGGGFYFHHPEKGWSGMTDMCGDDWEYEGSPEIEEAALEYSRRYYGLGPYVDIQTREDGWYVISAYYPEEDDEEPRVIIGCSQDLTVAKDSALREIARMQARLKILHDKISQVDVESLSRVEGS